jgi:hypothetical protein
VIFLRELTLLHVKINILTFLCFAHQKHKNYWTFVLVHASNTSTQEIEAAINVEFEASLG